MKTHITLAIIAAAAIACTVAELRKDALEQPISELPPIAWKYQHHAATVNGQPADAYILEPTPPGYTNEVVVTRPHATDGWLNFYCATPKAKQWINANVGKYGVVLSELGQATTLIVNPCYDATQIKSWIESKPWTKEPMVPTPLPLPAPEDTQVKPTAHPLADIILNGVHFQFTEEPTARLEEDELRGLPDDTLRQRWLQGLDLNWRHYESK